jgi:hypothetical protein
MADYSCIHSTVIETRKKEKVGIFVRDTDTRMPLRALCLCSDHDMNQNAECRIIGQLRYTVHSSGVSYDTVWSVGHGITVR